MRTIKELLTIMLEKQDYFIGGLCGWVVDLYSSASLINNSEQHNILNYIKENRPSKFSSLGAFINRDNHHYWPVGNIKPRIKWLKKHIKLNS